MKYLVHRSLFTCLVLQTDSKMRARNEFPYGENTKTMAIPTYRVLPYPHNHTVWHSCNTSKEKKGNKKVQISIHDHVQDLLLDQVYHCTKTVKQKSQTLYTHAIPPFLLVTDKWHIQTGALYLAHYPSTCHLNINRSQLYSFYGSIAHLLIVVEREYTIAKWFDMQWPLHTWCLCIG